MAPNIKDYAHPNFTIVREHLTQDADVGSSVDFAPFRVAQKSVVSAVHIICKSAPSASQTYIVKRNNVTIASLSGEGMTSESVGSLPTSLPTRHTLTLTTNNTLNSIGDLMVLQHLGAEDGQYDVIWEYRVLPGAIQTNLYDRA